LAQASDWANDFSKRDLLAARGIATGKQPHRLMIGGCYSP